MAEKAGQFSKSVVTQLGKGMIVESQNGKILSFTRVALGDGLIEDGEDIEKLTSIKQERLSCPIRSFVDKGNGQFALQFEVSNAALEKGFWHREIGVMAKIGAGAEQLYAYSYAGTAASFLYDKTTPIQERIVKIDVVVGNTENLTIVIDSSIIHPTMAEVDARLTEHNESPNAHQDIREAITAHRTAAELDHPERSVRKKHLHQDVYESPALTGTPTAPTAGKGTNNGQIASTAFVAQAIAALVNSAPGALDTLQELAAALGNDANFATTVTNALAGKLGKTERADSSASIFNGAQQMRMLWDAQSDQPLWVWGSRDGDAAHAYVWRLANLRVANANTVEDRSLQWILSNTGIVAGNLAKNGWVKFANSLMLQWGAVTSMDSSGEFFVPFPIRYPSECFVVLATEVSPPAPNFMGVIDSSVTGFILSKYSGYEVGAGQTYQWISIGC